MWIFFMNAKIYSIKPLSMFPKSISAKNLNLYLEEKRIHISWYFILFIV